MSEPIAVSIIVPAYNESVRIARGLEQILAYLERQEWSSEVIVVDDGSTDETAQIVQGFIHRRGARSAQLVLLSHPRNRGKGGSIKTGVFNARGVIVVFTDADLSAPIIELPKLLDPIWQGTHDIVIGSRALDRRLITHRQSLLRECAGRIFNLLMRGIVGLTFKDTQCGFKAYRRASALPLFRKQRLEGFGFDVEILYLAQVEGLRTLETPVMWKHVEGSRVHVLRDSLKMFLDLLKIRLYALTGKYAPLVLGPWSLVLGKKQVAAPPTAPDK